VVERPLTPLAIGRHDFEWGTRTFVMGIVNVTPDSFSGDGLISPEGDFVGAAVDQARRMAADGADILDIGGQSTRPGHVEIDAQLERDRVLPVVRAVRQAMPDMPLSVDTTRADVASAALDAGADMVNHVWGVAAAEDMLNLAAARSLPIVLMHNRREARYRNVLGEVIAELQAAIDRAVSAGVRWESVIVDPGIGFGKTAEHNLELLRQLQAFALLGRPVLLGTSRKSTIGKVLDLPPDQRLEGTLATTALGVAAGVDVVRVHDVEANVRAARMADAVVRGGWHEAGGPA
jgi:dihydropteroate synthase